MADPVQGEGDYDSARKYDERTRKFIDKAKQEGKPLDGDGEAASEELTPEEREVRQHARDRGQDQRDADLLRNLEDRGDGPEAEGTGMEPSRH